MKNKAEEFRSEKSISIQQKLNQILDKLYVELVFSSLTELNHLIKSSKNEPKLKTEVEVFIKSIINSFEDKSNFIELKQKFEDIRIKIINDPSIYTHIRNITKKIVKIVQEHDEIKDDYDNAFDVELDISKTYLRTSLILMALGGLIILFSILNCYIDEIILIGNINKILLTIILLLIYILLLIVLLIIKRKKVLDELHKKILDIEQESLDISSIND